MTLAKKIAARNFGQAAEERTALYLTQILRWKILARNYRTPRGEIDIVAIEPRTNTLVFVEVRARAEGALQDGEETLDFFKRQRLIRMAHLYLAQNYWQRGLSIEQIRLDLVSWRGKQLSQHIKGWNR
jgi:putative endonuclease